MCIYLQIYDYFYGFILSSIDIGDILLQKRLHSLGDVKLIGSVVFCHIA
jgi:hypothetical protein